MTWLQAIYDSTASSCWECPTLRIFEPHEERIVGEEAAYRKKVSRGKRLTVEKVSCRKDLLYFRGGIEKACREDEARRVDKVCRVEKEGLPYNTDRIA